MSLFNLIKNIFLILILILIIPFFVDGIKKQYSRYLEYKTQVGTIRLQGTLSDSTSIVQQLQTFFKNTDIKAVLLKIDCSGSNAGTGETIAREIEALKKEYPKPIISLVQNMCTSGAYWIACQTDYIIAPGTAIIGGIGVCFPYLFSLNEFIEHYKIKYNSVKAGTYKSIGDPFKSLSPAEQALLQSVLDDSYDQFTQVVAVTRKLSLATRNEWADGKIFSGRQAFEKHLIDEIGSLNSALRIIKEKALIEGDVEFIYSSSHVSLFKNLLSTKNEESINLSSQALKIMCTFFENKDILAPLN